MGWVLDFGVQCPGFEAWDRAPIGHGAWVYVEMFTRGLRCGSVDDVSRSGMRLSLVGWIVANGVGAGPCSDAATVESLRAGICDDDSLQSGEVDVEIRELVPAMALREGNVRARPGRGVKNAYRSTCCPTQATCSVGIAYYGFGRGVRLLFNP